MISSLTSCETDSALTRPGNLDLTPETVIWVTTTRRRAPRIVPPRPDVGVLIGVTDRDGVLAAAGSAPRCG